MLNKFFLAAALAGFAIAASAADAPEQVVRDAIHSLNASLPIDSVEKSAVPGFYEASVGGTVVYVSADGKYMLQGNLYDVPNKVDLTGQHMARVRKSALDKLPQGKRIVFSPKNPKHTVTVFTDIDCPYCRQFHAKIGEYNSAGIAVNYLLFPLTIHPGADKKAIAVWCADDRNAAYTAAMSGQDPGGKTCENPVSELTSLAMTIGVNGTPSVFAEDGSQISTSIAYTPQQLLVELDKIDTKADGKTKSAK